MPAPTAEEIKRLREAGAIDDAQAQLLEKRRADEIAAEAQAVERDIQANMPAEAAQPATPQPQAPAQPQPAASAQAPQAPVGVTPQQVETAVDAAEEAAEPVTDPLTEQPIQPQPQEIDPVAAQAAFDAEQAKLSMGEQVAERMGIDPDAELPAWAREEMENERLIYGKPADITLERRKELRAIKGSGRGAIEEAELKRAADDFLRETEKVDQVVDEADRIAQMPQLSEMQQALEARNVPQQSIYNFVKGRFDQLKRENNAIVAELEQKSEALKQIPEEGFWGRQDTPGKILFGIATALGALSQAGGAESGKQALRYVNNAIQQDLQQQRLGRQEQLAHYDRALDIARLKLQQVAREAGDVQMLAQAKQMDQQLEMQQMQINQQRMMAQALQTGQLKDPALLDEKQRERAVRMPDGSIRLADNKKLAEKVIESEANIVPSIQGLKRLLVAQAEGSRLSPRDRQTMRTMVNALAGQLKESIVGGGPLSDSDFKIIIDTIGDPTKVFSLPSSQRAKLMTTLKMVQERRENTYRQAGIEPPRDIIARMRSDLRQRMPDAPESAIDAVIESRMEDPEFRKQLLK